MFLNNFTGNEASCIFICTEIMCPIKYFHFCGFANYNLWKNTYLKLTTPSLSHLLNHFLDLCQKTHDTLASPFVMILHHGFSAFCFLMQFLQS